MSLWDLNLNQRLTEFPGCGNYYAPVGFQGTYVNNRGVTIQFMFDQGQKYSTPDPGQPWHYSAARVAAFDVQHPYSIVIQYANTVFHSDEPNPPLNWDDCRISLTLSAPVLPNPFGQRDSQAFATPVDSNEDRLQEAVKETIMRAKAHLEKSTK